MDLRYYNDKNAAHTVDIIQWCKEKQMGNKLNGRSIFTVQLQLHLQQSFSEEQRWNVVCKNTIYIYMQFPTVYYFSRILLSSFRMFISFLKEIDFK